MIVSVRWCATAGATIVLAGAMPIQALAATSSATPQSSRAAMSKPPSVPIPASERLGNATAKATKTSAAGALATPSASSTPNPATTTPSNAAPPATGAATPAAPTTSASAPTLNPTGAPLTTAKSAHAGSSHLSTVAIVVAIIAALIALAGCMWVLVRWLSPEPLWARSLMYSIDEASFRASSTWSEFTDWVRLGR